jgi:hypothetical protein
LVHPERLRRVYLQHDVPALTVAYDDPCEYTIKVTAANILALRRALWIDLGADMFDAVLCRSREIVKRGESTWLNDRDVPFDLERWAPSVTIGDDY